MTDVEIKTAEVSEARPRKPRKKQGRKARSTAEAEWNRNRVIAEINHTTAPYSDRSEEKPNTLTALLQLYSLPPIDLDDAAQVERRCVDYIKWCADTDALPSFSSLALALGVDRITLLEWGVKSRVGQPHSDIVKRMKALITSNTVVKGADGSLNPVYAMFLLNNSNQGFTNSNRLEVAQAPQERVEAPKVEDVIEIYADGIEPPKAE